MDTEQASRLLDEHLNDVFNKLPDEAFDLFTGMRAVIKQRGKDYVLVT